MPLKIRLSRHGRKRYAYFHIIAADSRAPRDGKFVERIGSYNPNTNPATIELNFERALYWMQNGAQPTDTARSILSDEGVLLRRHLDGGVRKGALTQEQSDAKFQAWKEKKVALKQQIQDKVDADKKLTSEQRLKAEAKKREAKAMAIIKKNTPVKEEAPAAEQTQENAE